MPLSPPIIFPSLSMSPMTITPNLMFIFPAYVSIFFLHISHTYVHVCITEQHTVLFPVLLAFKKYAFSFCIWYLPILVWLLQFNPAPFNNTFYESATVIYPFSCWCIFVSNFSLLQNCYNKHQWTSLCLSVHMWNGCDIFLIKQYILEDFLCLYMLL